MCIGNTALAGFVTSRNDVETKEIAGHMIHTDTHAILLGKRRRKKKPNITWSTEVCVSLLYVCAVSKNLQKIPET